MNRWVYVVMTNATCALILNQYSVVIETCPFLNWSIGKYYQDVKRWLRKKGLLEEWREMGEIQLSKTAKSKLKYYQEQLPDIKDVTNTKNLLELELK